MLKRADSNLDSRLGVVCFVIMRVKAAGAKRVEVVSPAFEKVTDTEVAQIADFTVNYGGLEDD